MLSFRWIPQLYVYQLGRCSPIKQHAVLLATPMKGGKNPPQDRVAAEESQARRVLTQEELFSANRESLRVSARHSTSGKP